MAYPQIMLVVIVAVCFMLTFSAMAQNSICDVYIGCYTDAEQRGISRLQLNTQTGELVSKGVVCETDNPSFLTLSPDGKYIYSANEWGKGGNAVTSFRIEADGSLKQLSAQDSGGKGPCHVSTDRDGKCLMVANYNNGSFQIYPLAADGTIGKPLADAIQHVGSSVVAKRQDGPHAHGIYQDPSGKYALAVDLGTDQVAVYELDASAGTLGRTPVAAGKTDPGAGPRHLAFSPDGKYVYVTNELNSTVTMFQWDPEKPALTPLQTLGTLPEGFTGRNSTAEIAVHPNGRMLYVSNRGHDSIAVFAIEPQTGRLALHAHQSSEGGEPRHFAIDPTGKWMLVTNQKGNNVVLLSIAPTGELSATGKQVSVKAAVCALYVQR